MHPHGAANDQKHRQAGGSPSPAHATFAGQILYPRPSFLPTTGKPVITTKTVQSLLHHETGCIVVKGQKYVQRHVLIKARGPSATSRNHHGR
jgi:hypothetical protein